LESTVKTEEDNPLFEQRMNNALDGLQPYYYDHLKNRISKTNATTIIDYILAMKVETNLSDDHRRGVITTLKLVSQFLDDKPFKEMTRNDILSFLDSKRKSKIVDPMHKWITTYSHHLINLLYILEPGKGFEFHTQEFIDGYIDGFCDNSPSGRGSDADEATFNCP
jgi:hypothetical protein